MRVSTAQIYNSALTQMQNSQARLAEIQEQISTGKSILSPSDDPVASARILKLERELARSDVYDNNIDAAQRRLDLEEETLDSIYNVVQQVNDLVLQANNSTMSEADRNIIAEEIRQLQSTAVALMNTKDSEGEYLFSGSQGSTLPFEEHADGSYSFEGDDGQRYIQAGSELQLATTDSGQDIFMVLEDDIEVSVLGQDSSLITTPEFTDAEGETFSAFSEEYGDIQVQVSKAVGGGADDYVYTITDSSGTPLVGDEPAVELSDIAFNIADTVQDTVSVGGITFDIGGLSTDSIQVVQDPGGVTDTRAVSEPQVLDNDAYLTFVETYGSDINVAMTIGTNAGEVEYDYVVTDGDGNAIPGPYTITPAGPITESTQVTVSDGTTDFLTFTLTPLTNADDPDANLVSDDSSLSVGVYDDTNSYITATSVTDPTATTYSDYAAANGDAVVVFQNNGGVIEYDIQDGSSNSLIGGFTALPADGEISSTTLGIDLTIDVATVTADLPNPGDTTVGGGEITLTAQVDTVLSGVGQVTLRADQGRHSILDTMTDIINALETPAEDFDTSEFADIMAEALEELDESQEVNLETKTSIGARINSLETASSTNADYKLYTETALSLLQDLDYASAVTEFSLQQTALEASQATFSRITGLSLFNYI